LVWKVFEIDLFYSTTLIMKIGLLPLMLCCLFTTGVYSQKVLYSKPSGNIDHVTYNVVGYVKDHIIIWEYSNYDYSTSRILVYDKDMRLLNKIKFSSVSNSKFTIADFINEKDSFDIISQYVSHNMFFCKRLGFDENGNNTRVDVISSYKVGADIIEKRDYGVIQSPDQKNFILIHTQVDKDSGITVLSYILFAENKIRFDHSTKLPGYDSTTGYLFSLDNANHFIAVERKAIENNKLLLYQINPGTGNVSGIQGIVQQGVLNMQSLNISNANDHVFITAFWKDEKPGIFMWQPDLYNFSAGRDTIYTLENDTAFTFDKFSFLRTDVRPFNNTYNLFVTPEQGRPYFHSGSNEVHNSNDAPRYYIPQTNSNYSSGSSFYYDRPQSVEFNNSTIINGVNTKNAYNDRDVNPMLNPPLQGGNYYHSLSPNVAMPYNKLLICNIDENESQRWSAYLYDSTDKAVTYYNDPSNYLHTGNVNIFYGKVDRDFKQIMGLLTLDKAGSYTTKPVIIMNTSYKFMFSLGKKLSETEILYPCNVKNKLAFIKVEVK
jgi:hypothetical protein